MDAFASGRCRPVVLTTLELRHFRNLGVQELRLPREGVAVVGDNAQGKTNLLEAIYYLESFRSFRGAGDADLVAFSEDVFHLRGVVEGPVRATVGVGFDRKTKSKKVTVDGSDAMKFSSALGKLGAVVFSPADTDLVVGGPAGRRRFLDIVLSINCPGYLGELQQYRKWLAQRNAALRSEGAGARRAWTRAWERGLVRAGAAVTRMRQRWAERWGRTFSSHYAAISHGDRATLGYRATLGDPGQTPAPLDAHERTPEPPDGQDSQDGAAEAPDELGARFAELLDERWEHDLRRGATSVGPHRDDLVLAVVDDEDRALPLRAFGSGGQRRTAALALRLTEAETIRRHRGEEPLLLLDDAFAELDSGRSERVMSLLEGMAGQVILTVPREADAGLRGRALPRWRVRAGVVEA